MTSDTYAPANQTAGAHFAIRNGRVRLQSGKVARTRERLCLPQSKGGKTRERERLSKELIW